MGAYILDQLADPSRLDIVHDFRNMRITPSEQDSLDPHENTLPNKSSLLLSLPPELRSCIYSHLLPTGTALEYDHTWFYDISTGQGLATVTSHATDDAPHLPNVATLNNICHLIRHEVIDHYFSRNTFVLAEDNQTDRLERWLHCKSEAAFRSLRRVVIEHWAVCGGTLEHGRDECLRRMFVDLETLEMKPMRDVGGHEEEWSCAQCAVRAEGWPAEVQKDVMFEELRKGWEFGTIGAGDVERLIAVVKDVGNSARSA